MTTGGAIHIVLSRTKAPGFVANSRLSLLVQSSHRNHDSVASATRPGSRGRLESRLHRDELGSHAHLASMAYAGEKLAKEAKLSIVEARAIALQAHPGKITDEELEREPGGTGLRYSFDITRGRVTQEVGVDAETGRVLENAREGKNPD